MGQAKDQWWSGRVQGSQGPQPTHLFLEVQNISTETSQTGNLSSLGPEYQIKWTQGERVGRKLQDQQVDQPNYKQIYCSDRKDKFAERINMGGQKASDGSKEKWTQSRTLAKQSLL